MYETLEAACRLRTNNKYNLNNLREYLFYTTVPLASTLENYVMQTDARRQKRERENLLVETNNKY